MNATRRGFLAAATAGLALPSVARAAPTPIVPVEQKIVRRGRAIAVSPNGRRVVVAHDRARTVAVGARLVDVGGQPLNLAVSPDGRVAAVTTAAWDEPGLAIVDLATGRLRTRVKVGPAPFDVSFTRDGRRLVVSGGEQEGTVHVLSAKDFRLIAEAPIGILPRGVDGAWIALSGLDRVVRVDLASGRIRRTLRTPRLPEHVALSPDGRRLLVSHGGGAERVSEIDVRTGKVTSRAAGRHPSGVAWTRRGRPVVALGGSGEIVRLTRRRRAKVGGAPRGLVVAGDRAATVDALTGAVSKVRV